MSGSAGSETRHRDTGRPEGDPKSASRPSRGVEDYDRKGRERNGEPQNLANQFRPQVCQATKAPAATSKPGPSPSPTRTRADDADGYHEHEGAYGHPSRRPAPSM